MFNTKNTCKKQSELASTARLIQVGAFFALVASFIFRPDSLSGVELCAFHALTDLQCPGCGMTRAFCAISHGQFADAWGLNPLSFYLYSLTMLGLMYPLFVNFISDKLVRIIVLITVVAILAFGFWRFSRIALRKIEQFNFETTFQIKIALFKFDLEMELTSNGPSALQRPAKRQVVRVLQVAANGKSKSNS